MAKQETAPFFSSKKVGGRFEPPNDVKFPLDVGTNHFLSFVSRVGLSMWSTLRPSISLPTSRFRAPPPLLPPWGAHAHVIVESESERALPLEGTDKSYRQGGSEQRAQTKGKGLGQRRFQE